MHTQNSLHFNKFKSRGQSSTFSIFNYSLIYMFGMRNTTPHHSIYSKFSIESSFIDFLHKYHNIEQNWTNIVPLFSPYRTKIKFLLRIYMFYDLRCYAPTNIEIYISRPMIWDFFFFFEPVLFSFGIIRLIWWQKFSHLLRRKVLLGNNSLTNGFQAKTLDIPAINIIYCFIFAVFLFCIRYW